MKRCALVNRSLGFMSKSEHGLAFGTPKTYLAPYDKTNYELVNLSYNCNVKSAQSLPRNTVVRLTDRPACPWLLTVDVNQQDNNKKLFTYLIDQHNFVGPRSAIGRAPDS